MIVTKHLYKNFLDNKRIYNLNRGYWKKSLFKIGDGISVPLYNEHFSNGTSFYDGNPMVSAYIPKLSKSIRIIQEEVETDSVEIGAWTENVEYENNPVQELVISLELSKESAQIASNLIKGWLQYNWSSDNIENKRQDMLVSLKK